MTDSQMSLVEQHLYQQLFLHDLNWSAPDHPPITYTDDDGSTFIATNVSSYKGLRVWVCDDKPGSKIEAALDRLISKTSTDRLVIFHNGDDQVWRWPARHTRNNSTATRLTSHRHRRGTTNPKFAARLDAIALPTDVTLDANSVLTKVRTAFDVEAQNETRHASKLMARMYAAIEKAYPKSFDLKIRDHQISVTLARILFLMFGDDTGMWERDTFRDFVDEYTAPDGSDLGEHLSDLFVYLDTPPDEREAKQSAFNGFRYVNGGIFRERISLPAINAEFRTVILEACAGDWSTISPAVFGSMFQSVRDAKTRRELGEHYTSEENILKTLNPLFLDELRAEFEHIKTLGKHEADRLRKLRDKLGEIRFMDPACGCGNFIIVAYRELRDIELAIMERLQEITRDSPMLLANVGLKVTLDHFYGIEIDEWPARIAETAMFLIDRQCDLKLTERLGWAPDRLPIQQQATIVVGNATRLDWSRIVPASDGLVIAGNPPFIGQYTKTDEQAADARQAWGADYDGYLDYVTSWHAKTLDLLRDTDARWAFVTTNSITQGQAVPALFRPIFRDGWRIKFAHRTFAWTSEASGKAAVHCVIVGFSRDTGGKRRLFNYDSPGLPPREELVTNINAYLLDGSNQLVGKRMKPLPGLPTVVYGSKPTDGGNLLFGRNEARDLSSDATVAPYVRPYVGATELIEGSERWCLWLPDAPETVLDQFKVRERVLRVQAMREASSDVATNKAAKWSHRFQYDRQPRVAYLAIPRHVSENRLYFTASRFAESVICGDANFTAEDPDGYLFAIISSTMFITWQRMIGGRIKSDLRFSNTIVWNNFPMPAVDAALREKIIDAGLGVINAREMQPEKSLAEHYRPDAMAPELIEAHDALDQLVDQAFAGDRRLSTELDRQEVLFTRYEELTSPLTTAIAKGQRRRRG
ncbi:class I SAM-dependent DNA methyltransferase [Saxibacter everestensis]|uniref:site-specific DNA-methyltransferase (adenine-specific) n=1 Tax=Saxibacter everestensis TaxID=2909229 RepID=A0ABY8QTS8_9MICO|nr:class I SAM-dependent DNA methyltransferase [Brevibacteriaceae bacterium ZFBP1038]